MVTRNLGSVLKLSFVLALSMTLAGCASKKDDDYSQESAADMYDRETGGVGLGTLERVHFGYDRSSIEQSAASTLERNANVINGKSSMRVLVEGHCDNRGTNEYNIALGERRARSALDYLVSKFRPCVHRG